MCGRVIQSSGPLRLAIVEGIHVSDSRMGNVPQRYNAAPSQELLVIRHNHKTGQRSLDLIKWGLIPHWCTDPRGGRKPINAKAESVASLPTFRDAYAQRRCIVPVDGFFEWRAIKGARSELMTMWPISTRVNKPENDNPSLLDRTGDPFDVWAPLRSEGRA
jgi:putative SOS response-associated peptidase YedK